MRTLRRILIVHPYGIGDLLFVTPVLRALRLIPTVEIVDLMLGSRTREAVEHNPHVNEIFVVDKDRMRRQSRTENLREAWELFRKLKARRYDLILDYSLRREHALLGRLLLGVPRVAGFAYKKRGAFHNIRHPLPEGFWKRPVPDFYCDLAEMAGIPVEDRFLEYYFPPDLAALEARVAKRLSSITGPYLAVSPGGGDSWGKEAEFKRWPIKNFAELIKKLQPRLKFKSVCILGSGSEKELCEELKRLLNIPAAVMAGETSLNETAMMLKNAACFAGNDGGLVHLARALEVRIIAFYGPVPPEVYGPYPFSSTAIPIYKEDLACRPCYYKFRFDNQCSTIACLKELTPEEAMKQIEASKFFNK